MKEGKDNAKAQASDIAEAAPKEISVAVSSVQSEQDAISVAKEIDLGSYSGELLVTEDKNVFTKPNESKAINHASKQGLKLFRIQWP